MAQPAAAWWFAPLDRNAQEWIGATGAAPPQVVGAAGVKSPPDDWERYAQKPRGGVVTSTLVSAQALPAESVQWSSALAALRYFSGDYDEGDPPLVRVRLCVSPDTPIFEVYGPQDWHALCVRYPAQDETGRLVPDWGAVAADWDAVHLTLGGILTADQVRVESAAGWSELRFAEFEQTRWLRWRFAGIERLPDITQLLDPPLWLPTPPALDVPIA